jgi:hypothetical protein
VGEQRTLTVTARDAGGAVLPNAPLTWISSNPLIASISASGAVTGTGTGTATITIRSDAANATVPVTVAASGFDANRGLMAHYPFTGDATDVSGNGRHGTVFGGTLVPDRFGAANRAYRFLTGQLIRVPQTESLDLFPVTVSIWMLPDAVTQACFNLVSKYTPGGWNGLQTMGCWNTDTRSYFIFPWYVTSGTNRVLGGYGEDGFLGEVPADGQWHHLVFTVDSVGGRFYVNGRLADSHRWSGTPSTSSNGLPWTIGGAYEGAFAGRLTLDEARIYNRAMSDADVQALYQRERQP